MLREEITESLTHIPHFCGIHSCSLQKVMTQSGCGCFSITPRDTDDLTICIAVSPFDLSDDFFTGICQGLQDLTCVSDPRTLNDDITRHQSFKLMSLFFKRDLMLF